MLVGRVFDVLQRWQVEDLLEKDQRSRLVVILNIQINEPKFDRYLSLFDHHLAVGRPFCTRDQVDRHVMVHVEHSAAIHIRLWKERRVEIRRLPEYHFEEYHFEEEPLEEEDHADRRTPTCCSTMISSEAISSFCVNLNLIDFAWYVLMLFRHSSSFSELIPRKISFSSWLTPTHWYSENM